MRKELSKIEHVCIPSIKIAVCDSDTKFAAAVAAKIREQKPSADVKIFFSAEELLREQTGYAIYFLDIQGIGANGCTGLDAARQLRARAASSRSVIIFLTGFCEYMSAAFDVNAFHYLVKPVASEKFGRVLDKAWREAEFAARQRESFVLLKVADRRRKIYLRDILYVESDNKKVTVHTTEDVFAATGKMEELDKILSPVFFRCHRCYLVNFAHIIAYGATDIEVTGGDKIPLSQKKRTDFARAYLRYAKGGGIVNV